MGGRGGISRINGRGGGTTLDEWRFSRAGEALPPKLKKALEERFAKGTELGRDVYDYYIPPGGAVQDPHSASAYYSPMYNMIWMNLLADARNQRGAGTTWLHEHGHFVDYNIGMSGGRQISHDRKFQQAIRQDVERYEREFARLHNTSGSPNYNAIEHVAYELLMKGDKTNGIQDIYGGVHRNRHYYTWGHDNSYWTSDRVVAGEAAAHMFEAQFSAEKAGLMAKYLPSAWARYNELLEADRRRWK